MNDIEKLRTLLPHWIEHNQAHAAEFGNWADSASLAGQDVAAQQIRRAADVMAQANDALEAALAELGGAIDRAHHSHSH